MAFPLTDEQKKIVDDRGGELLVSAAAGSGKTRVLVERLLDRVTREGLDLDRFLVITYTKAAAAELRTRIAQELSSRLAENPGDRHLRRQSTLVYRAQISTIHAFCSALLREEGHRLDLDPDFRLCDEGETQVLMAQVLEDVLEEQYEGIQPDSPFAVLVDTLSAGRDDSRLAQIVLDVFGRIQSHPHPERWLREQREVWELSGVTDAGETVARENLEEYDAVCVTLVKLIRKIDKRDIKQLMFRANAPEGLAECVVVTVPEIKYVTNFRVGFYLNQVLLSIYRFVDDHHYDTSHIDWKEFFRILFGDKNVIEAATFILLEGVHRIDDYGDEVSETFNQLTMFALKELEIAPEGLKTQMLDLYVKRISRMFANRTFDLRANLLDIDPVRFPNLVKTVAHYANQISEIIDRGSSKN